MADLAHRWRNCQPLTATVMNHPQSWCRDVGSSTANQRGYRRCTSACCVVYPRCVATMYWLLANIRENAHCRDAKLAKSSNTYYYLRSHQLSYPDGLLRHVANRTAIDLKFKHPLTMTLKQHRVKQQREVSNGCGSRATLSGGPAPPAAFRMSSKAAEPDRRADISAAAGGNRTPHCGWDMPRGSKSPDPRCPLASCLPATAEAGQQR